MYVIYMIYENRWRRWILLQASTQAVAWSRINLLKLNRSRHSPTLVVADHNRVPKFHHCALSIIHWFPFIHWHQWSLYILSAYQHLATKYFRLFDILRSWSKASACYNHCPADPSWFYHSKILVYNEAQNYITFARTCITLSKSVCYTLTHTLCVVLSVMQTKCIILI
jgi:hypothetical protein